MTERIQYSSILLGTDNRNIKSKYSLLNIESKEVKDLNLLLDRHISFSFLDSETIITENLIVIDIKTNKTLQSLTHGNSFISPDFLPIERKIALVGYESNEYVYDEKLPVKYV